MANKDGGTQLGPYHLLRKLGEGGMGAVYLAEDPADGRRVAIQVLPRSASENAEFLRRFQREAQAATKLRHPCIAAGYAEGEDRGLHFYAMEYCDGEPLDRMLKRQNSLPPQRNAQGRAEGKPRSGANQIFRRGDGLRILSIDVR